MDATAAEASPQPQQLADEHPEPGIPTAPPWNVPGIPDASEEKCDPKWQGRVVWVMTQQKRTGKQMVVEMQSNRNYRNPRFMEKDIADKGVFQYGTCFPSDVWDPKGLPAEDLLRNVRLKMKEQVRTTATAPSVGAVLSRCCDIPICPACSGSHADAYLR